MNKFIDYYNSEIENYGGLHNYILAKSIEKGPLLEIVKRYAKDKKKVLESGCGSASNSIFLANSGFNVTCIDNNSSMIEFAKENAAKFEKQPEFLKKDIKKLRSLNEKFDVSFSHGVLEHYSDKQIINLINFQLSIAKFVVISVPSDFFKQEQAINGDERFLSKKHWNNLISQTRGKLVEEFGYFYDSKELKIKLLRFISNITLNKFPKTKPYIGFVIKIK